MFGIIFVGVRCGLYRGNFFYLQLRNVKFIPV